MIIKTQEACLKTATVEIKALTVSGKQVTLAVFRQLQEERLMDSDGEFRGVPWGHVNYHPDGCATEGYPHIHVVWQKGSELRRAKVEMPWKFVRDPDLCDEANQANKQRLDKRWAQWGKLLHLDQLFIAV